MRRWWGRGRRGTVLPDWAVCLGDAGRLARFEELVRGRFRERGVEVEIDDGYVIHGEGMKYGLTNLAQACAGLEEPEWAALIGEHFGRIERGSARTDELHELMKDLAAVRHRLVLRMWDTEYLGHLVQTGGDFVSEERAPGLSAILMVDDEDAVLNVQREQAAAWGVPTTELIEIALDNVARMEAEAGVEPAALDDGSEPPVVLYDGTAVWSAAMALRLESLAGMSGAQGAMVSVPTRSMFFSVPIDGPKFAARIGGLINLTQHAAAEGPGEVSRRLWWVRGGEWMELPYTVKRGKIEFMPPREFNAMVAEMAEEG